MEQPAMTPNAVEYPELRRMLYEALEVLANRERQLRDWGGPETPESEASFDCVIHALLDDSGLLPDPSVGIGKTLVNEREAEAVGAALCAFDQALGRNPTGGPLKFISRPEWVRVVEAAQEACSLMASHQ